MAKDPEVAFFKKLEGLQPCEVSELKDGTHIFAVYGWSYLFCWILVFVAAKHHLIPNWLSNAKSSRLNFDLISAGDNFFKPATYIIEALCAKSYEDTTVKLKEIEAQILRKRNELRQFEIEYRKVYFWTIFIIGDRLFQICSLYYFPCDVNMHWHTSRK